MGDFHPEAQVNGFFLSNFTALISNKDSAVLAAKSLFVIIGQMYKVFHHSQQIILASTGENIDLYDSLSVCIRDFSKLKQIVNHQIFTEDNLDLILLSEDLERLWENFKKQFDFRVAAGGWVFNQAGELLMIKRHGVWDIAKGHIDDGESIEECAIREVEEETGVKNLVIQKFLGKSYHIYETKSKKVLKETHWYEMLSDWAGELAPQTEESITKAKWIKPEKIKIKLKKGWPSLAEFYEEYYP